MKNTFINTLLSVMIVSCSNEQLIDAYCENPMPMSSRSVMDIQVNNPTYMVTDSAYNFYLTGTSYISFERAVWATNPNTVSVSNQTFDAYITFYNGGIYDIDLGLIGLDGKPYYCSGIKSVEVFEMNPVISGTSVLEKGVTNTFTVNYNNIVSDYNVEWDIPNGLSYWKNGKQLYLTPATTGTFEIKCRVVEQCPLHNDAGVHVSNWCTKTITVIDQMREDSWGVYNPVINSGGSLSFDLRYKSSTGGSRCYAMYYVVLYQGAYDGIYASQAWEWEKAWNESYYHPPVIDEDYGFVYCDWDYLDNESSILIGQDELFSRLRTISNFPSGKTIDDIEYIILFVRDNKGSSISQYSTECYFEYD